jgi:predicted TIM-barrel fold metal-dependent hydrolase
MQRLLQDRRFTKLKIILLHFSWPYSREAGWLASSFKGVYVDCGEIQAFNSRNSLVSALRELMHLSPLNKILYSSDAHIWPETHFVGARYFREALTQVLTETVADGDLTEEEAIEAAHMICYRNSIEAYKLKDVPSI